jgi:hypothetical protein
MTLRSTCQHAQLTLDFDAPTLDQVEPTEEPTAIEATPEADQVATVDPDRAERIARWRRHREGRAIRFEELAEKAKREANARFNSHNIQTVRGMAGEPVKIGHHSEKRHRRLLERADNDMRASFEASEKAKHYQAKALAAESNDSIDGRDPEALDKLREKLAELEADQARMKAVNLAYRKGTLDKLGFTPDQVDRIKEQVAKAYSWEKAGPHPAYQLSNNNANIKRVRDRIKLLEAKEVKDSAGPAPDVVLPGLTIRENIDHDACELWFDGKPSEAVRAYLRSSGFRWVRSVGCWSRRRSNATAYHVKALREKFFANPGVVA